MSLSYHYFEKKEQIGVNIRNFLVNSTKRVKCNDDRRCATYINKDHLCFS